MDTYKCTSDIQTDLWIADIGAGMHMSFCKDYFSAMRSNSNGHMIRVADDRIIAAAGIGTIKIHKIIEGITYERELQDVLYVPELRCNLFSVGSVNKKGYSFHSFDDKCEIREDNGKLALQGVPYGPLFKMLFKVKVPTECHAAQADGQGKSKLWHERMGHVNMRAVKYTCQQLGIDGVAGGDFFCEGCVMGKQSRKPHPSVGLECNYGPGGKIHTDVCRPVNISSPSGTRYFLLLKDQSTHCRKVCFMSNKSQVLNIFKDFEAFVRTQLGTQIKVLRSDNGTE